MLLKIISCLCGQNLKVYLSSMRMRTMVKNYQVRFLGRVHQSRGNAHLAARRNGLLGRFPSVRLVCAVKLQGEFKNFQVRQNDSFFFFE